MNRKEFCELLNENILVLDGAMGSLLIDKIPEIVPIVCHIFGLVKKSKKDSIDWKLPPKNPDPV